MTIGSFIAHATQQLTKSGVITARLDCLVLLEDELRKNRAALLAHTSDELPPGAIENLEQKIVRRCAHEPLAYIRGFTEFYGRQFRVTPSVLVPRPETELIIDAFRQFVSKKGVRRVADIGTGSGCIGITLALEHPSLHIDLYDISAEALKIAKQNSELLGAHNTFTHENNLLTNITQGYDAIVANLPYVPTNFPINEAATHEPKIALFAGADGLSDYQCFWQQIANLARKPKIIVTEAFPAQHHVLAQWARQSDYALEYVQDFIQLFMKV
ncbi:MAG TPA: peptide chain release factor N(5)-glutamine methyltransferase [Candidatus Saccharimonadales bacterium]|nr:peptide chain release factor N(5)-glutamine methyltransferase [Candidatus Saccharimonadales bacterium]